MPEPGRQSLEARGPPEDWYPQYVDPDEVEFDHAYWECRCGWRSDPVQHPSMTEHYEDLHWEYGQTVDCGVGKHVLVFEDGSVAEI